jgi:hypothetical protein
MTMAPSDPKIKNNAKAFLLMISCVLISGMSSAPGQDCLLTGYPTNRRGLYTLRHLWRNGTLGPPAHPGAMADCHNSPALGV